MLGQGVAAAHAKDHKRVGRLSDVRKFPWLSLQKAECSPLLSIYNSFTPPYIGIDN